MGSFLRSHGGLGLRVGELAADEFGDLRGLHAEHEGEFLPDPALGVLEDGLVRGDGLLLRHRRLGLGIIIGLSRRGLLGLGGGLLRCLQQRGGALLS